MPPPPATATGVCPRLQVLPCDTDYQQMSGDEPPWGQLVTINEEGAPEPTPEETFQEREGEDKDDEDGASEATFTITFEV